MDERPRRRSVEHETWAVGGIQNTAPAPEGTAGTVKPIAVMNRTSLGQNDDEGDRTTSRRSLALRSPPAKHGSLACPAKPSGEAWVVRGSTFNVRCSKSALFSRSTSYVPRSTVSTAGFTLLEIMMAVLLVLVASTMTYITFAAVTTAWRNGSKLTEDLHHGDFVMDQLVRGLRSAYYPDAQGQTATYGFWLEDSGGEGNSSEDVISWVKQGMAMTESNSATVSGPHRVMFSLEMNDDGKLAAAVRYWRPFALPERFDPMLIPPEFISDRVCGFNCRVATNCSDGTWVWSDTWEKDNTNRLPKAVELTLYLEPLEEGRPPVEIKRCVDIPVWFLSWGGASPPNGRFRIPDTSGVPGRILIRQPQQPTIEIKIK